MEFRHALESFNVFLTKIDESSSPVQYVNGCTIYMTVIVVIELFCLIVTYQILYYNSVNITYLLLLQSCHDNNNSTLLQHEWQTTCTWKYKETAIYIAPSLIASTLLGEGSSQLVLETKITCPLTHSYHMILSCRPQL